MIQVAPGGPGSGEGENCQFTHDKLREVIYTETGAVRRRVLHRHAYELLERASALATPAELAHHALLAGLHEPAFYQSVSAGDAALAVYAVRDAIVAYEQARHLLADQWNGDGEQQPAEPQARLYTQPASVRVDRGMGGGPECLSGAASACAGARRPHPGRNGLAADGPDCLALVRYDGSASSGP